MKIAPEAELQFVSGARPQLIQEGLVATPIEGVLVIRMWRADDVLDAIAYRNIGHLQRYFPTGSTVIDTGEHVAMNVDHRAIL
jgi:hypothetical protein